MHAGSPPDFSAHRRSVSAGTVDGASHETQALFTQKGAFGFPEQSLSSVHATQRPVSASHTGVPGRPTQLEALQT
jgi:hypothetical protein